MRPTTRGVFLLLAAAPFIALGSFVDGGGWLGLLVFGMGAALFAVDYWQANSAGHFDIERTHDDRLNLGVPNPVTLSVYSRRRYTTAFVLRDEPPQAFDVERFITPGEVAPRQTWQSVYHVTPFRRGNYAFGDITLRWRGPLGLVERQATFNCQRPVKVYPNLLDIKRYDLMLRQNRLRELGLRHSRLRGRGTEFERLREYLPDDEYRRINWKATARRHQPITVEYQAERSQSIIALIDAGRMMQSPIKRMAKLDYVINAVLLLGYVATGVGDKVGMMTFADDVYQFLAPKAGKGQFYKMLELLYAVEPQSVEPDYRQALSYLALKQRKRALVVLFTDLSGGATMDSLVAYTGRLSRSSLPLVVTISDPDVVAAAELTPQNSDDVYTRAAAAQLLDERKLALETLQKRGVFTLDVPANRLSWSVIDRYLELKGRGRL